MSSPAATRPTTGAKKASRGATRGHDSPSERLVEFVVLGGMALAAVAFVLPLLLVALPVYGALTIAHARGYAQRRYVLPGLAAITGVVGLVTWRLGMDLYSVPTQFVDVQLDLATAITMALRDSGGLATVDWGGYGLAVWPYAAAGGVVLGVLGYSLHSLRRGSVPEKDALNAANLTFRDAGEMAEAPERQMSWGLTRALGLGVVSLLSAPPGLGKGWWTWGWLRALQDGSEHFGLEARRPVKRGRFGRKETSLRVLWMTEEGPSFGETAKRFGIKPGLVTVLQRQDVAATDWPTIVKLVRREAWRRGCAYVIIDTIRAWCPQAEQTNELAAEVFNYARKELAGPGLGVLFVHHDRKGGGEYGEGVAGPNNLVGSTDVLIELKRVKGNPNARRMLVSRRFGDQDVTATLDGTRYVVGSPAGATPSDAEEDEPAPEVPERLLSTFELVRDAGPEGVTTEAVLVAAGNVASTTVTRRLGKLEELGFIERRGAGVRGSSLTWHAIEQESEQVKPPTSDPAYIRYLNSKAWQIKRGEILDRADGRCEECDDELAPGEAEVHHLTYERVGDELPDDLVALCPGCHRRAHAGQ